MIKPYAVTEIPDISNRVNMYVYENKDEVVYAIDTVHNAQINPFC
jgi:hypothetical protein